MTTDGKRTAVVGGGRMGTGIAHALLLSGASVVIVDSDEDRVGNALAAVRRMITRSASKNPNVDAEALSARLTGATGPDGKFDLVVEAVPEIPEIKTAVLGLWQSHVAPQGLLATNTSSISIDALAADLDEPERFVGMHFFNPVPVSSLVEVVRGAATTDGVVADAAAWVEAMDKTGIVVRDSPGFASSRLGVAIGLEAIRMVEEGVASAEDIDAAMVLGYKFPIGPLKLTDIVGLDVRLGIAEYLASALGPRFEPPQLMRDMVEEGKLGQKSGQGFYAW